MLIFGIGCGIYISRNYDSFFPKFDNFNIDKNCNITYSKHIEACGIDAEFVENYYIALQAFLGATSINEKVKIYVAKTGENGSIGFAGGVEVVGVYYNIFFKPDVVIFDGQESVLIHELTHVFFRHMKMPHKDEAFAQIVVSRIYGHMNEIFLQDKLLLLSAVFKELINDAWQENN